jgi:hypothetical protein
MNDPYLYQELCFNRLLAEYRLHKRLIVAVDFDDTVFDFHKAGYQYEAVLRLLRRCTALGFYITLFTCSDPSEYARQIAYLLDYGVLVTSVNENPVQLPFGNHGKPYYNILLDDRAGLCAAYQTLESVATQAEADKEHVE